MIPNADVNYIWLDSTPEVAPFGFIQKSLRGKQGRVMPARETPRLMSTPPDSLSPEGNLVGHIEWRLTGDSELVMRTLFHQLNPGQWEQATQQISYRTGFTGKVSAADISNPQDTSKPFHLAYDYARERYADWNHLQIVPPFPPYDLAAADTKPSQPIDLGDTSESIYNAIITLPRGIRWRSRHQGASRAMPSIMNAPIR